MKNILTLIVLLALCASTMDVSAQSRRTKKDKDEEYFDESGSIGHRLWYGTHFNLGFNGNGFFSLFQFGLSPMVGFKINDIISVGPRASFLYYGYRENNGGGVVNKVNTSSWSVGAFSRVRPFPNLFAQVEYNIENEPIILGDLSVARVEQGAFYVGGGFNSGNGGPIAFEGLLMFNVNQRNSFESPLEYRVGLTYKF